MPGASSWRCISRTVYPGPWGWQVSSSHRGPEPGPPWRYWSRMCREWPWGVLSIRGPSGQAGPRIAVPACRSNCCLTVPRGGWLGVLDVVFGVCGAVFDVGGGVLAFGFDVVGGVGGGGFDVVHGFLGGFLEVL